MDEPELGVGPRQCTSSLVIPVHNFLAKNEMTVVPQPPYSPDLAPADFFMFSKLKSTVKGRCSDTPPEKFDEGVVHHSERSVPESVQKLAETLEAVFC